MKPLFLLRAYPRKWRERYGAELQALVGEQRVSLRLCMDLLRGAADAHLHPELASVPHRVAAVGGSGVVGPQRARATAGVVGAGLVAFGVWSAVRPANAGFSAIAAALAVSLALFALVAGRRGSIPRAMIVIRSVLLAAGMVAIATPFLANAFVRLTYDRYIWVISQSGPCAYLGSSSILVSVLLVSTVVAFGVLGMLVGTRGPGVQLFPRPGLYLGAGIVALGGLLTLPDPRWFAFLIGCS